MILSSIPIINNPFFVSIFYSLLFITVLINIIFFSLKLYKTKESTIFFFLLFTPSNHVTIFTW